MDQIVNQKQKTIEKFRFLHKNDYKDRILSFMVDVSIALSPMMIWNIVMLAVLGSLISFIGLEIINIVVVALLVVSIFWLNAQICVYTKGQTIGMYLMDLKLVQINGKKATKTQIYARNLIGFAIPFTVLMIFTNIIGILLYWIIDVIVLMIDHKHRQIIDFLTRTTVVRQVSKKVVVETVKEVEPVKEEVKPKEEEKPSKPVMKWNHVDLHVHSNLSMGADLNIEEIFQHAKKHGMKVLSITDLNTAKSVALAQRMSTLYGIDYVSGIEIQTDFYGNEISLLGYFINATDDVFTMLENNALMHEKQASIERVHRFEEYLGMPIQIESLLKNNRFQHITKEIIVDHVVENPDYQTSKLIQQYDGLSIEETKKHILLDYFAPGKPCYVQPRRIPLDDAIDIIKLTGGLPVLANPSPLYQKDASLLKRIVSYGIVGLEVFRPEYTDDEEKQLLKIAMNYKLMITCGSDFYSEEKGGEIGLCGCPAEAEALVNRLAYFK